MTDTKFNYIDHLSYHILTLLDYIRLIEYGYNFLAFSRINTVQLKCQN